jgi:hypothetical protein
LCGLLALFKTAEGERGKEEDVEGEGRMVGSYSHVSTQFLYLRKHDELVSSMMSKLPLIGTDHNQLPCLVVGAYTHVTLPKPATASPVNAILHQIISKSV